MSFPLPTKEQGHQKETNSSTLTSQTSRGKQTNKQPTNNKQQIIKTNQQTTITKKTKPQPLSDTVFPGNFSLKPCFTMADFLTLPCLVVKTI